ncbi:MAG: preprotein translocase subunit SecE [Lacipirellulaceae bacterium]
MVAYLQQLFHVGLYKRSQGRYARQWTLIAIAIVAAAGSWALHEWMKGLDGVTTAQALVVPFVALGVALWAAFRLIQFPVFADFLISVEAEMNKVSWPTQSELVKASAVVIFVIFFLAIVLFAYDFVWKAFFRALLG